MNTWNLSDDQFNVLILTLERIGMCIGAAILNGKHWERSADIPKIIVSLYANVKEATNK